MSNFPNIQIRAQEELDSVVGKDRLPTSSDRGRLPYIEAVVKETLRWYTAAPMGLPHVNTKDETFEELFIPRGSIIMANIW